MKILIVIDHWPFPEDANGINKVLCNLLPTDEPNIEFDLLCSEDRDISKTFFKKLIHIPAQKSNPLITILNWLIKRVPVSTCRLIKWHRDVAREIELVSKNYDLIHIFSAKNSYICKSITKKDSSKFVLSAIDSMSLFFLRKLKISPWYKRWIYGYEYFNWKNLEKNTFKYFAWVHVVSKIDQNHLNGFHLDNIVTIENGTNVKTIDFNSGNGGNLVFWGDLSYGPNKNALEFLINKILPKIDQKLTLFGKNLPSEFKDNALIDYRGFVPSIFEELSSNDIFICPLKYGTGIKNKALEAMGYGIKVLVSPLTLEGISESDDYANVVNDFDPSSWVNAITTLKGNQDLMRRHRATSFIKESFSWNSKRSELKELYNCKSL